MAFQAAIDSTANSGATTVYVPRGSYLFTNPVYLRGNVKRMVFFRSRFGPTSAWNNPGKGLVELGAGDQIQLKGFQQSNAYARVERLVAIAQ